MKLRIEIDLDNAVFEDEGPEALEDILLDVRILAEDMEPKPRYKLRDSNGNPVGFAEIVET